MDDVEEDAEEVAGGAGEYEEVPHGVEVGDAFGHVEDGADGVEESAGREEDEAGAGHGGDEGFDREDDDPAHAEVDEGGEEFEAAGEEDFEHGAAEHAAPDDAEEDPRQGGVLSAEGDEREGGVGAGDEEVDGDVVAGFEDAFGAGVGDGVVEGGGGVHEQDGDAENDAADAVPGVAVDGGAVGEQGDGGDSEYGAYAVGDAAGEFFAECVGVFCAHAVKYSRKPRRGQVSFAVVYCGVAVFGARRGGGKAS